jgi:hypothetical protein
MVYISRTAFELLDSENEFHHIDFEAVKSVRKLSIPEETMKCGSENQTKKIRKKGFLGKIVAVVLIGNENQKKRSQGVSHNEEYFETSELFT